MSGWALLMTAANVEQNVAAVLAQKQLAHHLFMKRSKAVVRGRLIERLTPAFSRYIFVRPEDQWSEIRDVPGVFNFVHFGEGPEMVNDNVVDNLVKATSGDVFPYIVGSGRFREGQKVRIAGMSPFHGFEGIYERSLGEQRADLLIDLMGRKVHVSVDERDVEELPQKRKRRRRRRFRHNARLRVRAL